jgi:phosphoesterase RecJ-like protein
MNSIQEIADQIIDRDNFILLGHAIPDGDCVGSLLGLFMGLKSLGKNAEMFLQDKVPPIYNYLSCVEQIKNNWESPDTGSNIIYLDCSDEERVGDKIQKLLQGDYCRLNIDHHRTNDFFGNYNYVDPQAAATAEIVFELLIQMKVEISPDIAAALYAGIIMDTGSFMNSNTTSHTMRVAGALLEKGADTDTARINLFESKSRKEIFLIRQALQSVSITEDGRIAWMVLPYDDINAIGAADLHPEGIINYARMINGVEVAVLFRETKPGTIKIGFRSKNYVDVASLAEKIGGGGHRQAAGASLEGRMDEVIHIVIDMVRDVMV